MHICFKDIVFFRFAFLNSIICFSIVLQMDTLVNPFKQASIGIVKGVSKIGGGLTIVSDSVVENASKIF